MKPFLISCLDSRIESDGTLYSRYLFGPFHQGKGVTVATALRRSLLSEVAGLAVTAVEIVGVPYEYTIIPGTHESVLDLMLNLKKLVFTSARGPSAPKFGYVGYITARGPATITGHDLLLPPGIQCINPDQVLARVAGDGNLNLKIRVSSGKKYLVQSGRSTQTLRVPRTLGKLRKKVSTTQRNLFFIDAVFMPVLRVNYALQSDENVLDFPLSIKSRDVTERIIFEIWTDGTLTPREGLDQAVNDLIRSFSLFRIKGRGKRVLRRQRNLVGANQATKREMPTLTPGLKSIYRYNPYVLLDIGILPLYPNQLTQLKAKNIHRIGDLVTLSYTELLELPELTEARLFTLLCHLRSYGLQLRTPIPRA
jgi:DNA-directed RNA polymerase subunit alpha